MVVTSQQSSRCPECGSTQLLWNKKKGEVLCRSCGLVLDDTMIDFSQEWREFDEGGSAVRRGGAPMTYTQYDRGLGTELGTRADLSRMGRKDRSKFFRLRKWQYRISTAIERNLKMALGELKRVSSFLKLPGSVEEEAARIYTQAVQRGLVRGRSMESVVAGALYTACRRHNIPRTLEEMSEASGTDKKEIGRTYRFVTRELGIKMLPSRPGDYIPRFASALRLNAKTQSKAIDILEKARQKALTSGRGPTGIAAAALYVAALLHGEKRTQREVADVAGVTEVTIRNRYKEILDELKLEKMLQRALERAEKAAKRRR
ncbi:transcription initiation factor IIB [Candidatus Woesearchaeota archaeon]|nr:transcription initiation factor IIB [Candidatus Woesearchaeota archaeon]